MGLKASSVAGVAGGPVAIFNKSTGSLVAPGAGMAFMYLIAGTNPGTAKLIIYAGTSSTPTTVADNIGGGF